MGPISGRQDPGGPHVGLMNFPVWEFCEEHSNAIAVLCAKFQNDLTTETGVMDERDFARFEFKMRFGRISYIVPGPGLCFVVVGHSSLFPSLTW